VTRDPKRTWLASNPAYPWFVVGLLWFCGFFNYADRQAVFSVFPLLEREFGLSKPQLGWVGSSFMVVYAAASPFSGYTVDLLPRRLLITAGLTFWSLICAATALSRNFFQLLFFRGAEGLGESFYFPASMSLLADYHRPRTRSRALGIHQTSVYLGTAGGAVLAGFLGERFGWRSPFWILGCAGIIYAVFLWFSLAEPLRESNERDAGGNDQREDEPSNAPPAAAGLLGKKVARIVTNPPAALLLLTFFGANFVAAVFLTWLTTYIFERFDLGLSSSSLTSTFWPLASLPGVLVGGVLADWRSRRSRGGRIRVQSLGLFLASPFVFLTGWSTSTPMLIGALIGAGMCKGLYDANIFASLYDVIGPEDRGTAAGLMNTVGWTGASLAPATVGIASERLGLGLAIASTAAVYVLGGLLALLAAELAERRRFDPV
jgi:MFS family permease